MIEIVERATCPTCGGNRYAAISNLIRDSVTGAVIMGVSQALCSNCNGTGTVPRVLATFADAAALRAVVHGLIDDASIHRKYDKGVDDATASVLAALGVSDDQS